MVHNGTDYQFAFSTLLQLIGSSLNVGVNISFGTTLPQNSTGKNGDVFINTNAGSFAQKIANVWVIVYTLPSSAGTTDGTVLYGMGIPNNSTGNNNDTYINTATGIFYKKTSGTWSQVFSMQTGPAGPPGTAGTNGTNGSNGFSVLNGTTTPSNLSTGVNGDFYINTTNYTIFGPKTAGNWGSGLSLIGEGIAIGGSIGEVLAKSSNANFDNEWLDLNAIYLKKMGGSLSGDVQQSASPINANSLITKGYADNLLTGLSWKQEVKAATTGNITLSGTQTIDSVAVSANDRVLVKNQTAQTENGIYIVQSGAWVRAADADTSFEIGAATVLIRNGTANKNTQWTCTNSTDPVIGTDNITFGQISGAGTYTNGTGINLIGNVFSLNLANPNTWTGAQTFSGVPVTISGAQSASAWGVSGLQLRVSAATLTNASTAASGTAANLAANSFARPTFASTNTGVTVTNASTLYVAGPPIAGTNTTLTNAFSLYVAQGNNYLGNGKTYLNTTTDDGYSSKLQVNGAISSNNSFALVNPSNAAGTNMYHDYWFGAGLYMRQYITATSSNTADMYWYSYNGSGFQNIMYLVGGGGLRLGNGASAAGDGSGIWFQVQNGTSGGFAYAGNFTAGGGNGIALGGDANSLYGQINAYNYTTSTQIGLKIFATNTIFSGYTKATQYRLSALNTAPSSSTATGVLGEIRVTTTAIYICTATDTWVKTSLTTF